MNASWVEDVGQACMDTVRVWIRFSGGLVSSRLALARDPLTHTTELGDQ